MSVPVRRGLNVPLAGAPAAHLDAGPPVRSVALMPPDHPGLRPVLAVTEGECVARGQTLFTDRGAPAIRFVAPAAGIVERIHRGERRALESVVVRVEGDAAVKPDLQGNPRERLQSAGLWPAFRTRPFGRIPAPEARADAIFVTAIDTHPLAARAAWVLQDRLDAFEAGLEVLTRLTEGPVHVCAEPDLPLPPPRDPRVRLTTFEGPHPAGLPGTHIHHLAPVGRGRTVWHVGCQDVVAIGRLFAEGRRSFERIVALGGPCVRRPRLLTTLLGASIDDLVRDELDGTPCRVLSGSVLSGRQASGWGAWLGRHHAQVVALPEAPSAAHVGPRYSFHGLPGRRASSAGLRLSTWLGGQPAPSIALGSFERVVPLRLLVTPLLRALLLGDLDTAESLGCLELDEEDLALCTFVCPSKLEYGPLLRRALDAIERGG